MKTIISTLAIALTTLACSTLTFAKTGLGSEVKTVLNSVRNINEIEIHGNVQVYLTTGEVDKVTVYDNYYAKNALVQEESNQLRITSYAPEKLTVWVTVSNLSKLSIYDEAEVKSFGKFSAIDVAVNLHDRSVAQLDMDAFIASFAINGFASANLSGTVQNGSLTYSKVANVEIENLTAVNMTENLMPRPTKHGRHPFFIASL